MIHLGTLRRAKARPSTCFDLLPWQDVDARHRAGHDDAFLL